LSRTCLPPLGRLDSGDSIPIMPGQVLTNEKQIIQMTQLLRLGIIFSCLLGMAQHVHSQVLEDYSEQWEVGTRETWISSNDRLILNVDLETFPLSYLSFDFPAQSVIFMGDKLWFSTQEDSAFSMKTEELRRELNVDKVELTVIRQGLEIGDATVQKTLGPVVATIATDAAGKSTLLKYNRQVIRDFFIVGLILSMLMLAIYKLAYPFIFEMMVKPISLLNAEDFSESGSLQKFFSIDILWYVFLVNMLLSLAGMIGLIFFRYEWLSSRISLDFWTLTGIWLLGALALLIITILKFTAIKVLAYLFDLGRMEFSHFFYLLRLILITTIGLLLFSAFFLFNKFYLVNQVLHLSFAGFFWMYLAGIFALFLIMVNRLGFKKYHLFTYLCIAELVPFLILAKWAMVIGY